MAVEIARHLFTIEEYHAMFEHGILTESDRVELIAGEVIEMPPNGPPHGGCVNFLTRFFVINLGERAVVSVQNTIMIPPYSQPQPDLAVLRPRADFYREENPDPSDVLLVVEVSDSTLRFDRLKKRSLYARAGIVETWVIDINGRAIEIYADPNDIGYAQQRIVKSGETLAPTAFPDLILRVSDVFGL